MIKERLTAFHSALYFRSDFLLKKKQLPTRHAMDNNLIDIHLLKAIRGIFTYFLPKSKPIPLTTHTNSSHL